MSIDNTLAERENRYGPFVSHAELSQQLKEVMVGSGCWTKLNRAQAESLEMIMHKVARILNGDPNYIDNWHDIAGYATLVEQILSDGGVAR